MGHHRFDQRWRLPRLALLQNHHCWNRPRPGGDFHGELITVPAFTGASEQLWRFDQLTDGSWRIMPKEISGMKEPLALSAIGSSFATLSKFDPASDKQRWTLKAP